MLYYYLTPDHSINNQIGFQYHYYALIVIICNNYLVLAIDYYAKFHTMTLQDNITIMLMILEAKTYVLD